GSERAPANTPLWVFPVGAPPPVRKRSPAKTPSQPQSHPGRVLLRFRARPGLPAAAAPSGRRTAPGANAEPSQDPEPAPSRTRGGCSYGSERAPANTPLWAFHVGARPGRHAATGISCRSTAPGAKAEPSQNPEPAPIAPGAGAPTVQSTPR